MPKKKFASARQRRAYYVTDGFKRPPRKPKKYKQSTPRKISTPRGKGISKKRK